MELKERLNKLIGHDVLFSTYAIEDSHITDKGILEEVGADYLVIQPWYTSIGFSTGNRQWFIYLREAVPILHLHNCRKCVAKPTT
jgi:hypothetical protein